MRRNRVLKVFRIAAIGVVAVGVFGFVVMSLWNLVMPAVFGLKMIGYWQALGLLILTRIFFGRFGGPGRGMHWRGRMAERLEQMTPEEREKFLQGMRHRCGREPVAAKV